MGKDTKGVERINWFWRF